MNKNELAIGQEVWVSNGQHDNQLQPIMKIGRALVTVGEGWNERQFRIEDQTENVRNPVGYGCWFRTQAQKQAAEDRSALLNELKEHGLVPRPFGRLPLSNEALQAIAEVLRKHGGEECP